MNPLRWILALAIVFCSVGFTALFTFAGGFRRSFGASELSLVVIVLPLLAAALMLLGLAFPEQSQLLHAGAFGASALLLFVGWQIVRDPAPVLWLAACFLIVWFVYYGLALARLEKTLPA